MSAAEQAATIREGIGAVEGEGAKELARVTDALAALDALVARCEQAERDYEEQREYADSQYRIALAAEAEASKLASERDEAHANAAQLRQALRDIAGLAPVTVGGERLIDRDDVVARARAALTVTERISGENFGAMVQEAKRLLDTGDEAAVIAYLTGEPVEKIRSVLPPRAALTGEDHV